MRIARGFDANNDGVAVIDVRIGATLTGGVLVTSSEANVDNGRWNRCSAGLTSVPEPSTLILLGSGLLFMTRVVRRFSAKH
jgi:PEP-CTERM motif